MEGKRTNSLGSHVLNVDSFLDKMRDLRGQIDIPLFANAHIDALIDALPTGKHKEDSLIIMVYTLAYRSESRMANLFMEIVNSDMGILDKLEDMYINDNWPASFHGLNQIPTMLRAENSFLASTVGLITRDRSYQLVSTRASSPIVSLFQVLKWFDASWKSCN